MPVNYSLPQRLDHLQTPQNTRCRNVLIYLQSCGTMRPAPAIRCPDNSLTVRRSTAQLFERGGSKWGRITVPNSQHLKCFTKRPKPRCAGLRDSASTFAPGENDEATSNLFPLISHLPCAFVSHFTALVRRTTRWQCSYRRAHAVKATLLDVAERD